MPGNEPGDRCRNGPISARNPRFLARNGPISDADGAGNGGRGRPGMGRSIAEAGSNPGGGRGRPVNGGQPRAILSGKVSRRGVARAWVGWRVREGADAGGSRRTLGSVRPGDPGAGRGPERSGSGAFPISSSPDFSGSVRREESRGNPRPRVRSARGPGPDSRGPRVRSAQGGGRRAGFVRRGSGGSVVGFVRRDPGSIGFAFSGG